MRKSSSSMRKHQTISRTTTPPSKCGNLQRYHAVLATIVAMLVLTGGYLLGVCYNLIYSYTLLYHRGSLADCTVGSGCRWTCSSNRFRSDGHAAAARSLATRRRGPRRRGGHAAADLSATRRPRVSLARGHTAAGPSATRWRRHRQFRELRRPCGGDEVSGHAAARPAAARRPRDG